MRAAKLKLKVNASNRRNPEIRRYLFKTQPGVQSHTHTNTHAYIYMCTIYILSKLAANREAVGS